MRIKSIIDEDIVNYKKISMFLSACFCDWKCCKEAGIDVCTCQNAGSYNTTIVNIPDAAIVERYVANDITKAVVIGGFEPLMQMDELCSLIDAFRERTDDDIVVYTGFYKHEKEECLKRISAHKNIIIKFGRFLPNQEKKFDNLLGVYLASPNQYAEKL